MIHILVSVLLISSALIFLLLDFRGIVLFLLAGIFSIPIYVAIGKALDRATAKKLRFRRFVRSPWILAVVTALIIAEGLSLLNRELIFLINTPIALTNTIITIIYGYLTRETQIQK